MDRILRIIACLLLAAILVIQILILQRMPPTINDLISAKGDARRQMILKQPMIRAEISEPLRVEVDNTPLEVKSTGEYWRY